MSGASKVASVKKCREVVGCNWLFETVCSAFGTSSVHGSAGLTEPLRGRSTHIRGIELEEKISGNH